MTTFEYRVMALALTVAGIVGALVAYWTSSGIGDEAS